MNTTLGLRLGACAAVVGAVAQAVASILEPDWGGDVDAAVRVVAHSSFWNGDRLLDLVGMLATVTALTIVNRLLSDGEGEWSRIGQPFLVLMAALGAGAIATGAAMKEIADTWGTSQDAAQSAYLASFHGLRSTTEVLFFAAFLAMGLYLATLAAAILAESVFPHWLGWASAVSAGLVITGNMLSIVSEPAWLAVLAGFALFLIVLLALGVCLWRREPSAPSAPAPTRATDRIVA